MSARSLPSPASSRRTLTRFVSSRVMTLMTEAPRVMGTPILTKRAKVLLALCGTSAESGSARYGRHLTAM